MPAPKCSTAASAPLPAQRGAKPPHRLLWKRRTPSFPKYIVFEPLDFKGGPSLTEERPSFSFHGLPCFPWPAGCAPVLPLLRPHTADSRTIMHMHSLFAAFPRAASLARGQGAPPKGRSRRGRAGSPSSGPGPVPQGASQPLRMAGSGFRPGPDNKNKFLFSTNKNRRTSPAARELCD